MVQVGWEERDEKYFLSAHKTVITIPKVIIFMGSLLHRMHRISRWEVTV